MHEIRRWCDAWRAVLRSSTSSRRWRPLAYTHRVFYTHPVCSPWLSTQWLFFSFCIFLLFSKLLFLSRKNEIRLLRGKVTLGRSSIVSLRIVFLFCTIVISISLPATEAAAIGAVHHLTGFLFVGCFWYIHRSLQQQREQQGANMTTVLQQQQTVTSGTNWATSNERQQIERRLALIHRDIELKRAIIKNLRLSLQQTNVSE